MAVIVTAILVIIILISMAACTTTRDVVETVTVHDTVAAIRTDTVEKVKVLQIRDTTTVREYHTYTVNNNGDTVRENHHLIEIQKTIVVDSTHYYQSERDSLRQALMEEKQKTKVVIKEKVSLKWLLISIAAAAIAVIGIIRDERNRIKKKIQQNQ